MHVGSAAVSDESISIEVAAVGTVNYAMAHNRVPIVTQIVVVNASIDSIESAELSVALSDSEGVLGTWSRRVTVEPLSRIVIDDVALQADPSALLQVAEERPGALAFELRSASGDLWESHRVGIRVLAANQWLRVSQILDLELLAAFVLPNDPVVGHLLTEAAAHLAAKTGNPSMNGYQGGPERADRIVEAIFLATQARRVKYSEPPASWGDGQKIRTPDQVLEGRFGTCLDTVVVMAAAFEQAGIRPLLWIAEGHAFLGYWRDEAALSQSVELDVDRVVNLVDLDLIGVVETTMVTDRSDAATFGDAKAACTRYLRWDVDKLIGVVDVRQARQSAILPLPARVRDTAGAVTIVEYRPQERSEPAGLPQGNGPAPDRSTGPQAAGVPPRVTAWKNSLLDLSLRNRLINLPEARSGASLLVPPGRLGSIEDLLNDSTALTLLPSDRVDEIHSARGVRLARDLPEQILAESLDRRRALFTGLASDAYATRLRNLAYKARTIEEDTGANNLYLALGTLVWRFEDRELRSPLILVPVHLRTVSKQSVYQIELDDSGSSTPNFCLLEKLRQSVGIEIPGLASPELDDSGIDLDAALNAVRVAIATSGLRARVEPTADLAILQFAKFRLWKDLDENWSVFARNPLVSHLISTPTQSFADSMPDGQSAIDLDALAGACPVPADASQLKAVASAVDGATFVLEGPPGTGKSQTITNLLARCVADGKRVLFVAEKRAALDVVRRRLDAVGLDRFALDLHDKASKPAAVRAQILAALDHAVEVDREGMAVEQERLDSSTRVLSRYRQRLHEDNAAGLSLYGAHDRELAIGSAVAMPLPQALLGRSASDIDGIRAALVRLPESADVARPRLLHPWGFVTTPLDGAGISAVAALLDRMDAALSALPADGPLGELLAAVTSPGHLRVIDTFLSSQGQADLAVLDEARTARWQAATGALREQIRLFVAAAHPGLDVMDPRAIDLPLADIHARAQQAAASSWFGRKKRLRAVAQDLLPAARPGREPDLKQLVTLTGALLQVQGAVRGLLQQTTSIPGLSAPTSWNPLTAQGHGMIDTQVEWLSWAGDAVAGTIEGEEHSFRAALRGWLAAGQPADAAGRAAARELAEAVGQLLATPNLLAAAVFDWRGSATLVQALRSTATGRGPTGASSSGLARWVAFLEGLEPLSRAGLHDAARMLRQGSLPADSAASAFDLGLTRISVVERLHNTGLSEFDAQAQNRTVERFNRASDVVRRHLHTALPREVLERRGFASDVQIGQIGSLRRELAKQRRGLAVRPLIARYGDLIVRAMPCVLVSPESLSRFFEAADNLFDVVVFDEASQIRVADAIGAMGRARSVVVVGDSKQMPPTSFAEPAVGDDDTELDALAVEDEESILTECVQAGVARQWLSWHYRSQEESLIAFSNEHYYERRLSSFPAPSRGADGAGVGLSLVRVDGHFERSGRGKRLRTNDVEAQAIAADIRARFAETPDAMPSIGVVTFNIQQRTHIEALLRDSGDERIVEALERRDGEGLFVKNLENVQGDERDVILFSVAFSPNERGVLPLNFGPLNRLGGERRLNVAVTRARRQIVVYTSFDPVLLRSEETTSTGIKHLRAYLDFAARDPSRPTADRIAPRPLTDRHRDEVAQALRDRGVAVQTDIGMSDFRVDIALASPGDSRKLLVAVLFDGPGWASRHTVGDRDGLPTTVLSDLMGWTRVERVWLPEWLADPSTVIARLVESLASADAEATSPATVTVAETPMPLQAVVVAAPAEPMLQLTREAPAAPVAPAGSSSALGGQRAFAPWLPRSTGDRYALDRLTQEPFRSEVQDLLRRGIDAEGPIHSERLAKVAAGAYGLGRVTSARVTEILAHAPRSSLRTEGGAFLWPAERDPSTWTEFRTSDDYASRPIEQVALREIANAMVALCRLAGGITPDELRREALRIFGGRRVTASISDRLVAALTSATSTGRLVARDDIILLADRP